MIYNGTNGYLATITFQEELQNLISKGVLVNNQNYWISGLIDQQNMEYIWSYNSGPEKDLKIYNSLSDQCFSYCLFKDPVFDIFLNGISVQISSNTATYIPTSSSTKMNFVCEWSSDNQPFVSQMSRTENKIIVNNIKSSSFPSLKASFVDSAGDTTKNFNCNNFIQISDNSAYCIPSSRFRHGLYKIKLISGSLSYDFVASTEPPWLTSINLTFYDNGQLTISGKNIEVDSYAPTEMVYLFMSIPGTPSMECSSKVSTYTVSCIVNLQQLGKIFPISIAVAGRVTMVYRAPIQIKSGQLFYSILPSNVTYEFAEYLASISNMEGTQGQLGVIDTKLLLDTSTKFYKSYSTSTYNTWQSVYYNLSISKFQNLLDPNAGQVQNIYYNSTIDTFGLSNSSRFSLDSYGKIYTHSNRLDTANVFIIYGKSNIFTTTPSNRLYTIPTRGSKIKLYLNNFGTALLWDTILFSSLNKTLTSTIDILQGTAIVDLPAGVAIGPEIEIKVINQNKTRPIGFIDLDYQYNKPVISSWSPVRQPTTGGISLFNGTDFFTDTTKIVMVGSGFSATILNSTYTSVFAEIPMGTGSNSITLSVGANSINFQFTYEKPSINTINFDPNMTMVTITGSNFGIWKERVRLYTLSGEQIVVGFTSIDHTYLIFPVTQLFRNGNYTIDVDGQSTESFEIQLKPKIQAINKPPVIGGLITIEGYNFARLNANNQSTQPKLLINNIESSNFTYISTPTATTPNNLYQIEYYMQNGTGHLQAQISIDSEPSNIFAFSYRPPKVLDATSIYKEIGGDVTVSGTDFALKNLIVTIGGIVCGSTQLMNDTMLICKNFGGNVTVNSNGLALVNVSVDSLEDSAWEFSYDIMTNITQPCDHICNNGGTCNNQTGFCMCLAQWTGLDCSTPKNNNTNPPLPDGNGGTIIIGNGLNFSIAISHLRELDPTNSNVKTLLMKDISWYKRDTTQSSYLFEGKFGGVETVVVTLNLTIFKERQNVVFAGETLEMEANSMKYVIGIRDWKFQSQLNKLQIIYSSITNKQSQYNCESSSTKAISGSNQGGSLTWYQINSGGSTLTARFAQNMIVDDRIVRSSVVALDNNDPLLYNNTGGGADKDSFLFMTAIQTSPFRNSVVIDPNFSSILKADTNANCSKDNKWKLIVIIVCSAVGGACIVVFSILYSRHRIMKIQLQKRLSRTSISDDRL